MLAATFELRGLRLELAKDRTLTVIDGATRRRISLSELSQQGDTVMADILNAQGNPYFDNVDVSRPQDGDWFRSEYSVISLSCELTLVSAISGDLALEFTADPAKLKTISRVVLPDGCLHTNASGITLPVARTSINLASVANGATFAASFSRPGIGWLRWRWLSPTGGGAGPKLLGHMQGSRAGATQ